MTVEAKGAKTAYTDSKHVAKHAIWLGQRKRNLQQYPQIVMAFSVSPNRWTTQTKTLLVRTVFTMMQGSLRSLMKTRWRLQLSTMLGCWRCFHVCSALVCHGSFSTLMTWCSLQTPRRSVSPSSRPGRLAWKVKGSTSTWRRSSSCSLVLAMVSSRNLASTPVLSAVVALATASCSGHTACYACIHKKCSGIAKWLVADPNYVCHRCNGRAWSIHGRTVTEVDVDSTMLVVEVTFCYLGDMLCSSGGCDSAIAVTYHGFVMREVSVNSTSLYETN